MKNLLMILLLGCLIIMAAALEALGQTGACCVDEECLGTMEENPCWWMGGYWYEGEDCEQGFECPTDYPCGFYVVGDYNGNGVYNVADVVDAFSRLKTGYPDYPELNCECPVGSGKEWSVRMDLNNSCTFNIADIATAIMGRIIPERPLRPCVQCPPAPEP